MCNLACCCTSHSGWRWKWLDESEHWCEVSVSVCVCVPASVPSVLDVNPLVWDFRCVCLSGSVLAVTAPFLLVNVVCEVVVSDMDCECVKPRTFSPENATRVWPWSVRQRCMLKYRPSKLYKKQS